MKLSLELRFTQVPLIILEMFLQLHWSQPCTSEHKPSRKSKESPGGTDLGKGTGTFGVKGLGPQHGAGGCSSAAGTGRRVRTEGKMNTVIFRDILDGNLLQSSTSGWGHGSSFSRTKTLSHRNERRLQDNSEGPGSQRPESGTAAKGASTMSKGCQHWWTSGVRLMNRTVHKQDPVVHPSPAEVLEVEHRHSFTASRLSCRPG